MAPRTAAPAAIAIQRHGREAAGVATAGGAAGATAGGSGTKASGGGEGGGVDAPAATSEAPQRGQMMAPLPCQVQHLRQTARPIVA